MNIKLETDDSGIFFKFNKDQTDKVKRLTRSFGLETMKTKSKITTGEVKPSFYLLGDFKSCFDVTTTPVKINESCDLLSIDISKKMAQELDKFIDEINTSNLSSYQENHRVIIKRN